MDILKRAKFQEYKPSANTIFVVKPPAPVGIRHNSKDSKEGSPVKSTVKVKYYTESKPRYADFYSALPPKRYNWQ